MNEETLTAAERPALRAGFPPPPEFGDVVDALDDAAAAFRVVVRRRTEGLLDRARIRIRERPLRAVALAAGAAWLIARLRR